MLVRKCADFHMNDAHFPLNVASLQQKCWHFQSDPAHFQWKRAWFDWKCTRQKARCADLMQMCAKLVHWRAGESGLTRREESIPAVRSDAGSPATFIGEGLGDGGNQGIEMSGK